MSLIIININIKIINIKNFQIISNNLNTLLLIIYIEKKSLNKIIIIKKKQLI